jgi:hypothetical protein
MASWFADPTAFSRARVESMGAGTGYLAFLDGALLAPGAHSFAVSAGGLRRRADFTCSIPEVQLPLVRDQLFGISQQGAVGVDLYPLGVRGLDVLQRAAPLT